MGRRIEMNPGEMFLIADRTILVQENESILGLTGKIGAAKDDGQIAYFFTFKGRVNHSNEIDEVTVAMHPQDALDFVNDVLKGLELLAQLSRKTLET